MNNAMHSSLQLTFDFEKFQLKLENEVKGFFYPVLSVDGIMNGKVINWSGEVQCVH